MLETWLEVLTPILCIFYLTQFIFVWARLFVPEDFNGPYHSKLEFLWWHVPFLPIIIPMILKAFEKVLSIGEDAFVN